MNDIIELCKAAIGWDVTLDELNEIGERKITMMRAFNAREGFTKKEDTMPDRFFQPIPEGPSQGITIDKAQFESVRDHYYKIAGWDPESGNPTEETLKKLGLDWI